MSQQEHGGIQWVEVMNKLDAIVALQSRATTESEMQAASAALTRMLTKYNLSMAEFERRSGQRVRSDMAVNMVLMGGKKYEDIWRRRLAQVLARAHGCRTVYDQENRFSYIIGTPENTLVVQQMYFSLTDLITVIANTEWSTARHRARTSSTKWKSSFAEGAVDGLKEALDEAARLAAEEVVGGAALVAMNDAAVQKALHDFFPNATSSRRKTSTVDSAAYASGKSQGRGMLHKRVGG